MSLYEYGCGNKTQISAPFVTNTNLVNWTVRLLEDNIWHCERSSYEKKDKMILCKTGEYSEHEIQVGRNVIGKLLQRFPQIFFIEQSRVMINTEHVKYDHYKLPGKHFEFTIRRCENFFTLGLALAENPKNEEKYLTSPAAGQKDSDKSYPYDNNRLKVPANKGGSDYVDASPISVCDEFTFIIEKLNTDKYKDGSFCKAWCAERWSTIFHNDVRYVIVIENEGAKREEEIGAICHLSPEKSKKEYISQILTENGVSREQVKVIKIKESEQIKKYTRQISTENGVSEETFEVEAIKTKKWEQCKKTLRNVDFTIKQGNTTKTVTHISIGNFGTRQSGTEKDDFPNLIMDIADCFKEMVEVLDKIRSLNSKSEKVPRVMLVSRSLAELDEELIFVYYLWLLAKNNPNGLVEKELWEHLSDLRLQRWNFVPCYDSFTDIVFLCQTLFLEGHEDSARKQVEYSQEWMLHRLYS